MNPTPSPITSGEALNTWPERIWLQHGDDDLMPYNSAQLHRNEITWCADNIHPNDVEYVRVDIAAAASAASAPVAQSERDALAVELIGVAEEMAEGSGFWIPCSGCHETEDGHPVGRYAYSHVFKCALGNGCRECGGIGAVWDSNDYEAMAQDWLAEERAATNAAIAAQQPAEGGEQSHG